MLKPQFVAPADLARADAEGLFTVWLTRKEPFVRKGDLIKSSLNCLAAQVALLDVDRLPRLVLRLAIELRMITPPKTSAHDTFRCVD